jgi:PAS domain S-box-containing protein
VTSLPDLTRTAIPFSEARWRVIIIVTSCLILLFSYYSLIAGVTTIFSHLYYIPIILLAYRYRSKGVVYSLVLGLVYLLLVLVLLPGNILEIAGALERFFIFTLVALVVAYLAEHLEQERREYQNLYHFNESIVSNAHVWLAVMDRNGRIDTWNKAAESITGFSSAEVIGTNQIWKRLYPDAEYRKQIHATIRTISAEKRFFENFVTVIRTKGGREKTISWNTQAIPDGGDSFARFVAIGIDITERKRAEEELQAAYAQLRAQDQELRFQYGNLEESQRALAESRDEYRAVLRTAMDGIAIIDMTGHFTDVNEAFCTMLGYSRTEMLALSVGAVDILETTEDTSRRMVEVARKGIDRFETRYRKSDGKILDIEVSAVFTPTRGGRFLTFHRDITERKRTEETLNRATKKLNFLNQITFSDIQSSVFSLSGYFELERSSTELKDEKTRQYLQKEGRIIQTINETLKFATNYQNLGLAPPLWQSVTQTFLYGISHLDMAPITRKLDVDDIEIYADPLLEKVFFTLAENVVLHGRTATEIAVYFRKTPDGITLFFEDNGSGISPGLKDRIFERRYEEKQGMGLFLVREILSITGITIRENSEPGHGALFEIFVPKEAYRHASAA